ncbi:MAG: hypothetical protein AAGU77_06045 [Bacillota bacterium]
MRQFLPQILADMYWLGLPQARRILDRVLTVASIIHQYESRTGNLLFGVKNGARPFETRAYVCL